MHSRIIVDHSIQSKNETTALYGQFKWIYKIIELSLKEYTESNIQIKNGKAALVIASASGHYQLVKLLVNKIMISNIQDKEQGTAFLLASRKDIIKW